MELIPVFLLGASLLANAGLAYLLHRSKKTPREKTLTVTAEALLHDLTAAGVALVKLERVAPTDVFLRSPRG